MNTAGRDTTARARGSNGRLHGTRRAHGYTGPLIDPSDPFRRRPRVPGHPGYSGSRSAGGARTPSTPLARRPRRSTLDPSARVAGPDRALLCRAAALRRRCLVAVQLRPAAATRRAEPGTACRGAAAPAHHPAALVRGLVWVPEVAAPSVAAPSGRTERPRAMRPQPRDPALLPG